MPQVLKDDLRDKIIESSKKEFLQKGFRGASMRSIAKRSGMTVGNLYRYFNNKDDIIKQIVSETVEEIEEILHNLTSNKVSFETRVFNLKANVEELSDLLDELSYRLVDTYFRHKTEFNILMLHSSLNKELTNWFSDAINTLIEQHFLIDNRNNEKEILVNAYSKSIFAGLRDIFRHNKVDSDTLKYLVSTYLHSYIILFESDFSRIKKR